MTRSALLFTPHTESSLIFPRLLMALQSHRTVGQCKKTVRKLILLTTVSLDNSLGISMLDFPFLQIWNDNTCHVYFTQLLGESNAKYVKELSCKCKILSKYTWSHYSFWISIHSYSIVDGRDCLESVTKPTHFFLLPVSQNSIKHLNVFQIIAKMKDYMLNMEYLF